MIRSIAVLLVIFGASCRTNLANDDAAVKDAGSDVGSLTCNGDGFRMTGLNIKANKSEVTLYDNRGHLIQRPASLTCGRLRRSPADDFNSILECAPAELNQSTEFHVSVTTTSQSKTTAEVASVDFPRQAAPVRKHLGTMTCN